eukprot:jgi/Undpi1/10417/HiC_scaffold_29.g12867.m1
MRVAVRRPAAPVSVVGRRQMSGDAMHAAEEMSKWKKLTMGMGALSVAVTALVGATEEHHHKDEDAPVEGFQWTERGGMGKGARGAGMEEVVGGKHVSCL